MIDTKTLILYLYITSYTVEGKVGLFHANIIARAKGWIYHIIEQPVKKTPGV